ncbi:MAG TPA: hypothetical protein VEO75_02435 [Nitrososphaerales archaeon]|nr:hypothetical protein [Nitrososphaerales archaeon]
MDTEVVVEVEMDVEVTVLAVVETEIDVLVKVDVTVVGELPEDASKYAPPAAAKATTTTTAPTAAFPIPCFLLNFIFRGLALSTSYMARRLILLLNIVSDL